MSEWICGRTKRRVESGRQVTECARGRRLGHESAGVGGRYVWVTSGPKEKTVQSHFANVKVLGRYP